MSRASVTLDQAAMHTLVERFGGAEVAGLMLMGSRARGSAGLHSDVDLVRYLPAGDAMPDNGSHLIDGRLVVVSVLSDAQIEAIFTEPALACDFMVGLRSAYVLVDRTDTLPALQRRARDFVWDGAMQVKANRWAADQLVGLIEEAHKGLEGLQRQDTGRLLNARFGLSWLLSGVVKVQRGVLLSGDNGIWDEINRGVGETSTWVRLRHTAFGIDDGSGKPPDLANQVVAGLRLYIATVALMRHALPAPQADLIDATVARITAVLGRLEHG